MLKPSTYNTIYERWQTWRCVTTIIDVNSKQSALLTSLFLIISDKFPLFPFPFFPTQIRFPFFPFPFFPFPLFPFPFFPTPGHLDHSMI